MDAPVGEGGQGAEVVPLCEVKRRRDGHCAAREAGLGTAKLRMAM